MPDYVEPTRARLAGYASIFDMPDAGRDVVRRGAFRRAVVARAAPPLLWQHDMRAPIGRVQMLAEDVRGLRVIASLTLGTRRGAEALALIRSGAMSGLSFGYRVRESRHDRASGLRELTDLDLVEVSLVIVPMQPLARVHALDARP